MIEPVDPPHNVELVPNGAVVKVSLELLSHLLLLPDYVAVTGAHVEDDTQTLVIGVQSTAIPAEAVELIPTYRTLWLPSRHHRTPVVGLAGIEVVCA